MRIEIESNLQAAFSQSYKGRVKEVFEICLFFVFALFKMKTKIRGDSLPRPIS